jgi:hypothetical protein
MVYGDLIFLSTFISLGDAFSGGAILKDDFNMIFIVCFMDEESSGVPSSICCNFCFLGFLFLAPTSLSLMIGKCYHQNDSFQNVL